MTQQQIEQAATESLPYVGGISPQDVNFKLGFINGAKYVIQQLYNTPLNKVVFELVEFMEQEENGKEND